MSATIHVPTCGLCHVTMGTQSCHHVCRLGELAVVNYKELEKLWEDLSERNVHEPSTQRPDPVTLQQRAEAVEAVRSLLLQQCENAENFGKLGQKIIGSESALTIERLSAALAELTR